MKSDQQKSEDEVIERLLSGKNQMSRGAKDAIFERVIQDVAPRRGRRSLYGSAGALVLATAALLLIPKALGGDGTSSEEAFRSRGKGQPVGALSLSCSEHGDGACIRGTKLLFDLEGTTGYTHMAALARHTDGTIIWYFPESPEGKSLQLSEHVETGVLDRGVLLGETHQDGDYEVLGFYSKRPFTRDEIKSKFQPGRDTIGPETAVIRSEFSLR